MEKLELAFAELAKQVAELQATVNEHGALLNKICARLDSDINYDFYSYSDFSRENGTYNPTGGQA